MSSVLSSESGPILSESVRVARPGRVIWTWTVLACVLLAGSALVRAWQDRQHSSESNYKETCPINVAQFPVKLGDERSGVWRLVKNGEKPLDDLTMRITGGTDHFVRIYANDRTGVSLVVLLLYGPAEPVLPHTPDVCYPSSGFAESDQAMARMVEFEVGKDDQGKAVTREAQFQSASYSKSAGRTIFREAVYHSFRLDGDWSPSIGQGRKFPRRNPGIFKIQIQRQVAMNETLGKGDPIEQFLSTFLSELEREIKQASLVRITAK